MQIIVRFGGLLFSSLFLDFSSLCLIFSVCSSNQHQRKEQSSFSLLLCTHSHCLLCSGSVSVFNFVLVSNNRGLILIDWQKRRGKALESIRKFNLGGRCTGTQLNSHRSRIEVFFVVAERDTGSPAANFLRFGTRWLEVVYFACFLGFLMFVLCLCLLMHTNLSID